MEANFSADVAELRAMGRRALEAVFTYARPGQLITTGGATYLMSSDTRTLTMVRDGRVCTAAYRAASGRVDVVTASTQELAGIAADLAPWVAAAEVRAQQARDVASLAKALDALFDRRNPGEAWTLAEDREAGQPSLTLAVTDTFDRRRLIWVDTKFSGPGFTEARARDLIDRYPAVAEAVRHHGEKALARQKQAIGRSGIA